MNTNYSCLTNNSIYNWNIKGVNLGGLFVLEPWITPSLFYQFLNENDKNKIGMDTYSFCSALGPEEGRIQLNYHFQNWINETDIIELKKKHITHVRIPIGDWMFDPYGPYIGCTDDSLYYLNNLLDICEENSVKVLLDLHGVKGSQNGFDNSGQSRNVKYIIGSNNVLSFQHWPIQSADWVGDFDIINKTYKYINYNNINSTKKVLYTIIDTYKNHPALYGIEPLNEPWGYTPVEILQNFYYDIYKYMHLNAPNLKFIYHDSFRSDIWDNFLQNCSNVAMDWHIYQAWDKYNDKELYLSEINTYYDYIQNFKSKGIELIIGEFSLAIDNCAMWLNGFQDNVEGYPITSCKYDKCPYSYISDKYYDNTNNVIGPFGTGLSSPQFGNCPYEGSLISYSDYNDYFKNIGYSKINAFSYAQGWFFWNIKTEFEKEVQWNFIKSYDKGYINTINIQNNGSQSIVFLLITVSIGVLLSIYLISSIRKKNYVYLSNNDYDNDNESLALEPLQHKNFKTNYVSIKKTHINI